jgi:hypothetical protein
MPNPGGAFFYVVRATDADGYEDSNRTGVFSFELTP